jgi:penicillin-binding protein 2
MEYILHLKLFRCGVSQFLFFIFLMYNRRLKIFVFLCFLFAAVCIARLAYIQLNPHSAWQSQLEKIYAAKSKELPALRGKILDRNGKVLAADEAKFALCIDYQFARLADERFWKVQLLRKLVSSNAQDASETIREKFADDFNTLNEIIHKCTQFRNLTAEQVKAQINQQINEPIWQLRYYLAWKRRCPQQEFETAVPDANERLLLAAEVDVAEMHQFQELFKLENDDEVFAAQLKFLETSGVEIRPRAERYYPFKSSASQLIGWVRPAGPADNQDFGEDELERYMHGETIGFCGVEYVCEPHLRGRRGKIVYNIDREIVSATETQFGGDVKLTIDIDLQRKIENLLKNSNLNPNPGSPAAVVVIDVNSTDVIALVSLPDFDLNMTRWEYSKLVADTNTPVINRVIEKHYPPGSAAKPFILTAGLAENKIGSEEIISCPSHAAPTGWPSCWIVKSLGYGHDEQWAYEGGNKARNALRGSCNIYFSQLASRIPPEILQKWLYSFGFGKTALDITEPNIVESYRNRPMRNFRQVSGIISSSIPSEDNMPLELLPGIDPAERRFFGIGQGNFRASILQVANAFAALARGGIFKNAKIIASQAADTGYRLGLSENALSTIYEGMHAVVSEQGGTAYKQFADSGFEEKGIRVFGKTGSTEKPYNAWFAGFAKDGSGKSIALAVLIEGGQHGSSDAGPIARDIISFCIEAGYLR